MRTSHSSMILTAAWALAACSPEQPQVLKADGVGDLSQGDLERKPFALRLESACGAGGTTPAGDEALLRMPYLQKVSTTEAELLWTSEEADACSIRIREPGGAAREIAAQLDEDAPTLQGRQYLAKLSGLRADSTQCYEVVCDGEVWMGPTGFRTAPPKTSTAPVRFVALGDLGESTKSQNAVARRLAEVEYDFALVTGDIAYPAGSLRSFEQYFFDIYAPMLRHIPFFVASGNHDNNYGESSPFAQVFALPENGGEAGIEKWYSFDWGPVHFAVLDTERIGTTQQKWLDADLARSDAPWKLVMGHRPPYSSGQHGNDGDVQEWFVPIFEKHQVSLTFWGHDHNYERTKPIRGVTYLVTGGGGKGSRPVDVSDFTAHSDRTAHFMHFTVDGDRLSGYAVDATGQVFDTLLVQRPGSPDATAVAAAP